jgi:mycothiol synthase
VAWPSGIAVRVATRGDLDEVVALLRSAELADSGQATITREDVESDWNKPGFELAADARVLHEDGVLVAYAEACGGRIWGTVAPSACGRGLGTAVLQWQEQRACEQARAQGLSQTHIGQTIADGAQRSIALLQAHGFTPFYTAWGLRLRPEVELSAIAPPADVRIRALRSGEERSVYEVIERAFSVWPGRSAQSFEGWRAFTIDRADFDPGLTFVALTAEGAIAGAVYGIHYPDGGWAQQLAVELQHRRRGIGRALLAALFSEFRKRGETRLGLGTDSRTGALDLYIRLGMEVERSFRHWRKQLVVT